MQRLFIALLCATLASSAAFAQQDRPFEPKKAGSFDVEALLRQEWTRNLFGDAPDLSRRRGRLLPKFVAGGEHFQIGVGGDFNYSSDENTEVTTADGTIVKPGLLRDNYKSRSARLDLAFVHLQPLKWLQVDGGRIVMPFAVTEMVWDKDLRPQGGALRLTTGATGDIDSLSIGALYGQGSHPFEDKDTRMLVISAEAKLKAGNDSHFQITGSWFKWDRLDSLEPMIRRQNNRATPGGIVPDNFQIIDLVGRIQLTGGMPFQLIGNICWNTKVDDQKQGLWLALVLGSLTTSRARGEYTFAQIDRDATVAAYNGDDFFWGTGWLGHRLELGSRLSDRMSLHAIGQLQRFKDSATVAERDHWVQRLRIEIRVKS